MPMKARSGKPSSPLGSVSALRRCRTSVFSPTASRDLPRTWLRWTTQEFCRPTLRSCLQTRHLNQLTLFLNSFLLCTGTTRTTISTVFHSVEMLLQTSSWMYSRSAYLRYFTDYLWLLSTLSTSFSHMDLLKLTKVDSVLTFQEAGGTWFLTTTTADSFFQTMNSIEQWDLFFTRSSISLAQGSLSSWSRSFSLLDFGTKACIHKCSFLSCLYCWDTSWTLSF